MTGSLAAMNGENTLSSVSLSCKLEWSDPAGQPPFLPVTRFRPGRWETFMIPRETFLGEHAKFYTSADKGNDRQTSGWRTHRAAFVRSCHQHVCPPRNGWCGFVGVGVGDKSGHFSQDLPFTDRHTTQNLALTHVLVKWLTFHRGWSKETDQLFISLHLTVHQNPPHQDKDDCILDKPLVMNEWPNQA